jgi:hypothetical protein
MNCCDDYGNCTQGRDCPAREARQPMTRKDRWLLGGIIVADLALVVFAVVGIAHLVQK